MIRAYSIIFFLVLTLGLTANARPELRKTGNTIRLFVNGEPALMLAVETTNKLLDKPDDLPYLEENFDMYQSAGVNTLLVPITWYSLEPVQGQFDYTMIDTLIAACRERNMMLVPLWFGSVKNGQIGYAPGWIKNDDTYFRAQKPDGSTYYAISPFCEAAMEADKNAFRHLMQRIKEKDPEGEVVVMVQPNNETGVAGSSSQRDMSQAANEAWNNLVPGGLMQYLQAHNGDLHPWLQQVWETNGKKTSGTWPEVFGGDAPGHQIFMSYYMARYIGNITRGGKAVYDIPMYVNDWLGSLRSPGGPVGGPDFQVHDVWRAAAPAIDLYAPDIYKKEYKKWCEAWHYDGNPLMVPEAVGKKGARGKAGAQAWYTFIQHDGLMYAPYLNIGDEYNPDHSRSAHYFEKNHLDKSYPLIEGMKDIILEKQQSNDREMTAFLMDAFDNQDVTYHEELRGIDIYASPRIAWPDEERGGEMVTPFAAVIWLGQNEFLLVGTKMDVQFSKGGKKLEAMDAQLGRYVDNQWIVQNSAEFDTAGGEMNYQLPSGDLEIEQVRFTILGSGAPIVSLVSPVSSEIYNMLDTVLISAEAFDYDGTIDSVEFYANDVLIGSDTALPFEYHWEIPRAFSFDIVAKAYDLGGHEASSEAITITMNTPPDITILSPESPSYYASPDTIEVTSAAEDDNLREVRFYVNEQLFKTFTGPPYAIHLHGLENGVYFVKAEAWDDNEMKAVDRIRVEVLNTTPRVSIVEPGDSAEFAAGEAITFRASLVDTDDDVYKVAFYEGFRQIGENANVFYETKVEDLSLGSHRINAMAYDRNGAVAYSDAVTVIIKKSTRIDQVYDPEMLSVYPNPLEGRPLVISRLKVFSRDYACNVMITMVDGKKVFQQSYVRPASEIHIPAETFQEKGMYFISLQTVDGTYVRKLLVK